RLGHRYFWAYAVFEVTSAFIITLGTVGLFALYTSATTAQFWRAFVVADVAVSASLLWVLRRARSLAGPLVEWVRAGKPPSGALTAWRAAAPLRWKLLGALPLINVITGVVVSGLSGGGKSSLTDLGLDVVLALAVAFTVSLELTLLLTKSIYEPVGALIDATERVKHGDLSA